MAFISFDARVAGVIAGCCHWFAFSYQLCGRLSFGAFSEYRAGISRLPREANHAEKESRTPHYLSPPPPADGIV